MHKSSHTTRPAAARELLGEEIRSCTGCGLAATRGHALPGEGPIRARIMLVAQAPGRREDGEGRMFCGPSGPILDELLGAARLVREEVYMTNLIKCHLPHNRRPRQVEIGACRGFPEREIDLVEPGVIVPMGFYATRHVLDMHGVAASPARADFKNLVGNLVVSGWRRIFPLPHPSSLLYDRSRMEAVRGLYARLSVLARPCIWYAVCPMNRFTAEGRLDPVWVNTYCLGDWSRCKRRLLEERGEPHPDWMLPDGSLDPSLREG